MCRIDYFAIFVTLLCALISPDNNLSSALEQSGPCTPDQDRRAIQCLRELPAEVYEVLQGEDVHMRCRTAHQKGKAQWRARNFLLGYERSITRWPRYSLQGDPRLGIHDLVIKNVSNEDEGEYECQVSPAAGQPPLRRQTQLNILIKPSKPIIIAPSGEPQPTSSGQLVVAREADSIVVTLKPLVALICQVKSGRPQARFEWFHNGLAVDGRTPSSSSEPGIEQSRLELERSALTSGDRIVCLVSNKATLRSNRLNEQKLRAEVIVVVHSSPGNPELINIDQPMDNSGSLLVTQGQSLKATCRCSPPGSPPGELVWRWQRDPLSSEDSNELFLNPSLARGDFPSFIPSRYIASQESGDQLVSSINLPNVTSEHHSSHLVCVVKHQLGREKTARVRVLVNHLPKFVHISEPEETLDSFKRQLDAHTLPVKPNNSSTRRYYVYADRPQYLICFTSSYYYADRKLDLRWRARSSGGHWQALPSVDQPPLHRIVQLDHSRSSLGISVIQLVSTNQVRQLNLEWTDVECSASLAGEDDRTTGDDVVQRVELELFESPGKPVITDSESTNLLAVGSKLILHCQAAPGNPPGRLIWMKSAFNDKNAGAVELLSDGITETYSSSLLMSSITTQVTRDLHGDLFRCGSENSGYPMSDQLKSDPIRINVAFAASQLTLKVLDSRSQQPIGYRQEGDSIILPFSLPSSGDQSETRMTFTCDVGQANPQPRIHWRLHRCQSGLPVAKKQCSKIVDLDGIDELEPRLGGGGGGGGVRSKLTLAVNWTHHQDIVECRTDQSSSGWINSDKKKELPSLASYSSTPLTRRVVMDLKFAPVFQTARSAWKANRIDQESMPQYIVVEGGVADVRIDLKANPPVTSTKWYKHDRLLLVDEHRHHDSRLTVNASNIRIRPVTVGDAGNYTVLASNEVGTSQFRFLLNVTYGPKLIGPSVTNQTVSGRKAQLECRAHANPVLTGNAVRWMKVSSSFPDADFYPNLMVRGRQVDGVDHGIRQAPGDLSDSVAGILCNKGKYHSGFKYFAKCWNPEPDILVSSLTIYELSPIDVGRYQCHLDNGVGSPAIKVIDLIYPFAPQIISIPRWTRSAPTSLPSRDRSKSPSNQPDNSMAQLTCVIAAEPKPNVVWLREPANLTLMEGGQFKTELKQLKTGLYHANLFLDKPREINLGTYYCKAINLVGEAVGKVELIKPTIPDLPGTPRLINATSSTLAVSWTQNFNGGPKQTFQLRWVENESPSEYRQIEIVEDQDSETMVHVIKGLDKATTYRIAVNAGNQLQGSTTFTPYLLASTMATDPYPSDFEAMRDEARANSLKTSSAGHWQDEQEAITGQDGESRQHGRSRRNNVGVNEVAKDDRVVAIIVAASVSGVMILIANLLIILFLARRRHRKRYKQHDGSIMSGNDTNQLFPLIQGYPDGTLDHRHMQPIYPTDSVSYTDDTLGTNQYPAQYHPTLGFLPANPYLTNGSGGLLMGNGRALTGSPHSSLQGLRPGYHDVANNPMLDYSFNTSTSQDRRHHHYPHSSTVGGVNGTTVNGLTESDLTGLTLLNMDVSPSMIDFANQQRQQMDCQSGQLGAFVRTPSGSGVHFAAPQQHLSNQQQSSVGMTPGRSPRPDSPFGRHSAAASSISTNPNTGAGNRAINDEIVATNNSLDRTGGGRGGRYAVGGGEWYDEPAIMLPMTATDTFGRNHHQGGNGVLRRPVPNSTTNQQSWLASLSGGDYNQQQQIQRSPMAASCYTDRPDTTSQFNELTSFRDTGNGYDLSPIAGGSQLTRRNSHTNYQPHRRQQEASNRMNTSQLLDNYLQRYNDQLSRPQANQRRLSPYRPYGADGNSDIVGPNFLGGNKQTSSPIDHQPYHQPAFPTNQIDLTINTGVIPPPNAFDTIGLNINQPIRQQRQATPDFVSHVHPSNGGQNCNISPPSLRESRPLVRRPMAPSSSSSSPQTNLVNNSTENRNDGESHLTEAVDIDAFAL